jgi:glutathione S-transferase
MLGRMDLKLYIVHGSHPCEAVMKALELKGLPFKTVELPPPSHALVMRGMFGMRTVPGLRIDGKEKISGSRAIMRRLDELQPQPPLLPADPEARERVLRAEEWGDEVLQSIARRIIWPALRRNQKVLPSFNENAKLKLPAFAVRAGAPLIVRVEAKMNDASDENTRADLRALPGHLDRVDNWIADGTLGGDPPNAADLQIASSIRLLTVVGDVRPMLKGRPCEALAMRLFPQWDGDIPAGTLPAEWIPAQTVAV